MWKALTPILLALWLWQLLNCWRRPSIPSLFGSEKLGRTLWLLSFGLLDPVQLLLYVGLVRFQLAGKSYSKLGSSLLALGLVAIGLLSYGLPIQAKAQSFTLTENSEDSRWGLKASVEYSSKNKSSAWSSTSISSPLAMGRLRLICESDEPLILEVGRRLCDRLIALPFVSSVRFVPPGAELIEAEGDLAPDFNLLLRAGAIEGWPFPLWQRTRGQLQLSMTRGLDGFTYTNSHTDKRLLWDALSLDMDLRFEHTRNGLAWGAARLGSLADSLSEDFGSAIQEHLEQRRKATWPLPDWPQAPLYEPLVEPAPLAKLAAKRSASECGFLLHNRTLWTYADPRNTRLALAELGAELEAEGWKVNCYETKLDAWRKEECIVAGRPGYTEPEAPQAAAFELPDGPIEIEISLPDAARGVRGPIRVVYEKRYDDSEVQVLIQELIDQAAAPAQLLALHSSLSVAQRDALRARLIEEKPASPGRWLRIAELAKTSGDLPAEVQAVRMTRVLLAAGVDDGSKQHAVDKRADALGVSSDAPSMEELRAAGFQWLVFREPMEFDLMLDKELRLTGANANGVLTTFLIRVSRAGERYEVHFQVRETDSGNGVNGSGLHEFDPEQAPLKIFNSGVNSTYYQASLLGESEGQVRLRVVLDGAEA